MLSDITHKAFVRIAIINIKLLRLLQADHYYYGIIKN